MITSWTNEDIEAILIQLNHQNLPFGKYEFSALGQGLCLLGKGASANVYEAFQKGKTKNEYAIKVIGFGNRHVDSNSFVNSIEAQKELGIYENHVVKIFDFIELRVWIEGEHEVSRVQKIDPYETDRPEGNYLHLQFVLMEKIAPVLSGNRLGHKLSPYKLASYDEQEIIKLAYDIGTAIYSAHKKKLIHRDIKLENIFYTPRGGRYKLGDFGIARTTDDGLASTVAFTKGYGAPEVVGTLDDKYDCTADIYSFGIMLYVLLNEMRFPESNNYHPNVMQYVQGYSAPEPMNGSDDLVKIVLKMISFDPDDRYQSMEEVLNELDKLKYGERVKYQREHRNSALVLGAAFAIIGSVFWKLSFAPEMVLELSALTYLLCTVGIGISIFQIVRKKTDFLSIGIIGVGVLAANITYLMMRNRSLFVTDFYEYRWMAVLLLSLAVVLLFLHCVLGERIESLTKRYLSKNIYWIMVGLYYIFLILLSDSGNIVGESTFHLFSWIFGKDTMDWVRTWNPGLVGIFGVAFCILWVAREGILLFIEKKWEMKG